MQQAVLGCIGVYLVVERIEQFWTFDKAAWFQVTRILKQVDYLLGEELYYLDFMMTIGSTAAGDEQCSE